MSGTSQWNVEYRRVYGKGIIGANSVCKIKLQ